MSKKIIAIDLDGVLCEEGDWNLINTIIRNPIISNIKKINKLYDKNNFIIIYTARLEEDRLATELWLKLNGIKYNTLVMNKLVFDIYIDEKQKLQAIEDLEE